MSRSKLNRRTFLNLSLVGSTAGLFASVSANAVSEKTQQKAKAMAGGLYFTKEAPGRWAKKAAGHTPLVKVSKSDSGATIKITTPHEMKGYEHYIVKHIVLDKDFKFLSEKVFDPTAEKSPISEHDVGVYRGTVYALSVCNLHDTWMASAAI